MSFFRNDWRRKWRSVGRRFATGARAAANVITLILDQFTDTDSTSLNAHTIAPTNTPATAWTEAIGDFDIQSNQANVAAAGITTPRCVATVNAGVANCVVEVRVTPVAGSVCGIVGRAQDAANLWTITISVVDDTFNIFEWSGNNATSRASASVAIVSGTTYTIRVVFSGTSISATMNGANAISYSSTTYQANTVFGIVERQAVTGTKWDNFTVTTL